MIRSFKHKGLKTLFETGSAKGIQSSYAQKLLDILDLLNSAKEPRDLAFPGSLLHPLKGKLKGYWAVRVSGNWRVVFQFEKGDVFDVNYVDYH